MLRRLLFCFRALALLVCDAVGRFAGGLAGRAALAAAAVFRRPAQIPRDYSFNSAHLKHSLKFFQKIFQHMKYTTAGRPLSIAVFVSGGEFLLRFFRARCRMLLSLAKRYERTVI
jgi:hypothetical protein